MQITITNVSKIYPGKVKALNALNLTIPVGMYGLLGPNGAGKTTLMRLLAGILRPTSGQILIGPYDLSRDKDRVEMKRALGYLPQDLGLYPNLTAFEFLDYIGTLKGLTHNAKRKARINELLDIVSLTHAARRKLQGFSGGMKRRIGIAQALLNDPKVIIVDEPTAGLDPEERIRFRNLLVQMGGDRTVLLSTHIVEDIAQTCNHLAVMKQGQIAFQGMVSDLLTAAQGHAWSVTTDGRPPAGDLTVVSTLHHSQSIDYRVVGNPLPTVEARPVEPGLEEGYIWLMHSH